jgi:circadian clock protein KaiB
MAKKSTKNDTMAAFQKLVKAFPLAEKYILRLHEAGISPPSSTDTRSITGLCEDHLRDRYEQEIAKICQQQSLARGGPISVAPTLIKKRPLPRSAG